MKPFIKYPGGKMKEFPLVDRFKPEKISRYFEPFVGGGSIYLNLNICKSYINDKSKDLANLYTYIKTQNTDFFDCIKEIDYLWKTIEDSDTIVSDLIDSSKFAQYFIQSLALKEKKIQKLEMSGYSISQNDKKDIVITAKKTAFYMCIRDLYNRENCEDSIHTACFYFIREYCYSSMFRYGKNGRFNVPYGGRSYNLKYMTSKIKEMQSYETVKYFAETSIFSLDFEDFLNRFDLNDNDFIFLDPPYDSNFSTYDKNAFEKKEQVRLFELLGKTKAKWMLIIKKTDFIYDLYKDFYMFEYDKNYLVSFKNRNKKGVRHLLITNYAVEV